MVHGSLIIGLSKIPVISRSVKSFQCVTYVMLYDIYAGRTASDGIHTFSGMTLLRQRATYLNESTAIALKEIKANSTSSIQQTLTSATSSKDQL